MGNQNELNAYLPLEIYVAYEQLPASQAALILLNLEAIYKLLLPDDLRPFRYPNYYFDHLGPTPYFANESPSSNLCLEYAQTGSSITFKFAGKGQKSSINWQGSDIEVNIPTWTATALGVGAIIIGGGMIYERYLESQLKKAQIQGQDAANKLTEAQIAKTKAETDEIIARLKDKKHKGVPTKKLSRNAFIERNVSNFYSVVNQKNISRVEINGISIKSAEGPNDIGSYK